MQPFAVYLFCTEFLSRLVVGQRMLLFIFYLLHLIIFSTTGVDRTGQESRL